MGKSSLFILALVGLFACTLAFEFGAMIDAGSSGTRIYVYRWNDREMPATSNLGPFSEPFTQSEWTKSIDIPLADLVYKDQEIQDLMNNQFVVIDQTLSSYKALHYRHKVPVYLGATAGLRFMPSEQREALMASVRNVVSKSGYQYAPNNIKVLSGEEEALYDWISVNYLNVVREQPNPFPVNTNTVGAMDLGGASTQLIFAPKGDIMSQYTEYTTPSRVHHNLYSVSHLGFGSNRALDSIQELIGKDQLDGARVDMPCMNVGYESARPLSDGRSLTFVGTSDINACSTVVAQIMNLNAPCPGVDHCSINGVYQPEIPLDMDMFQFSGFYYALSIFHEDGMNRNTGYIKEVLDTQCAQTWKDLQEIWPHAGKYLETACTNLNYVYVLLTRGYKISENFSKLHFVNSIQGFSVSWAFGRILYEANELFYRKNLPEQFQPRHSHNDYFKFPFFAAVVIIIIFAATSVQFFYKYKQVSQIRQNYELETAQVSSTEYQTLGTRTV